MKSLRLKLLATTLILAIGCSDYDSLKFNSNDPDDFLNTWLESYEEGYGVYRPSDYTRFPSSSFRQSYKSMEMNMCEYLVLSPVDAHFIADGLWQYYEQHILRIYNLNEEIVRELNVTSLSSELLQVEF